jgi:hypothetical protein
MEDKEELMKEISEAIQKVAREKEVLQIRSISRHNPDKVAEILYLSSIGNSQTRIVKKYGFDRTTVISILTDYADHIGKFRDLKELSIAKANASREALTARGEATQITEDRKVYTQDEYEATIKAARERIQKAKIIEAEVQDA